MARRLCEHRLWTRNRDGGIHSRTTRAEPGKEATRRDGDGAGTGERAVFGL